LEEYLGCCIVLVGPLGDIAAKEIGGKCDVGSRDAGSIK
jgi:hypothetical protein